MTSPRQRAIAEFVLDHLVWFMLAFVLIVFSIFIPNFFQIGIFGNIIEQSSYLGVMSIGLAIVILAGQIDLSVESSLALSAMTIAILFCDSGLGMDIGFVPAWLVIPVSLMIAVAIGGTVGLTNAFFVIRLGMEPFIVTLASFIWVRGLVLAVSGGRSAQGLPDALRFIGIQHVLSIPLIAWFAIACFTVFSFVMARTPFGRHIYLIGGNPVAAFRSGIRVKRLTLMVFVVAGAIAGVAGWILAIRTSGASANLGTGLLFQAFAAVVIGGVSLKGGVGKLPGVFAGALLLSSIHTAINLMGVPAQFTMIIQGMLVLAAVLLDTLKLQIRRRFA